MVTINNQGLLNNKKVEKYGVDNIYYVEKTYLIDFYQYVAHDLITTLN